MASSAEQIASAARVLGPELSRTLTLHADELVDSLATQLELVAWDREQLVGQVQIRLADLHRTRPAVRHGPAVRVIERRTQPLEAIDTVWGWLRRGRRVRLELEPGACMGTAELMRGMISRLPMGALEVTTELSDPRPAGHVEGGVDPPGPRIAVLDADADRELAAYVLARTALRRSGMDPRAVKQVYAAGELELLERHMRRLWVGVSIGPAEDHRSFAGPVSPSVRDRFLVSYDLWRRHPDVRVWCPGGVLERTGDPAHYLAPGLFVVSWPAPEIPTVGPIVVVVACQGDAQLHEAAQQAQAQHGQVVQIGGRPGRMPGAVRHVRGALLVERLPPGLPEPRPV
ncbi:MAG: hypothetical protein AAGF11_10530 [Myxococcota bacterium]